MCLAKGHNAVTPVRLEPATLCVHYSFAIILMGKREFVALLSSSSWCLVIFCVALPGGATGLSAVCDCDSYNIFPLFVGILGRFMIYCQSQFHNMIKSCG